jgi:hypothetical protein
MPKPTDEEKLLWAWTEAPLEVPISVNFKPGRVTFDMADFAYITMTAGACRDLAKTVAERINHYPLVYRPLRYLLGFLRAMADRADGLGRAPK